MGDMVKCICECGYEEKELLVGIGFAFIETGKVFTLAYCDHCGTVQTAGEGDEPPQCETCHQQLVYYDIDLSRPSHEYQHDKNREIRLWHCPACKTNRLHFEWMGLWD